MEFIGNNHVNSKLHVHLQKDYEKFLSSFERPAQIYRVLRERFLEQPIFLNRNLSYMRRQNDNPRTIPSRSKFNLGEILEYCRDETEIIEHDRHSDSCLKINFNNFSITNQTDSEWTEDTIWEATLALKRPDNSPAKFENINLGTFSFLPKDSENTIPLTIPFKSLKTHSVPILQQTSLIFSIKRLPQTAISSHSTQEYDTEIITQNEIDLTPVKSVKQSNGEVIPNKSYSKVKSEHNNSDERQSNSKKRKEIETNSYQKPTKRTKLVRSKNRSRSTPQKSQNTINISKQKSSQCPNPKAIESISKQKTDILLDKIRNLYPKSSNNIVELKLFNNKSENCLLKKGKYEVYFSVPESETSTDQDSPKLIRCSLSFALSWTNDPPTTRDLTDISTPLTRAIQKRNNIANNNTETPHNKQAKLTDQLTNTPTIYNFIYESNTYQQTQQNSRFECPLCSLVCTHDYSLLQHLNSTHPRLDFRYIPSDNLTVVDVRVNSEYDGSFFGDPKELGRQGIALWRFGPIRRRPYTSIIHYSARGRIREENITEFIRSFDDDCQQFLGMDRVFFHSRTCHPILPSEINSDSEDDNNEWLLSQTKKLINDFTDVNRDEKEIMKLWNIYMIQKKVVGDCHIAVICSEFAKKHREIIREQSLTNNFLAHLIQLSDQGLITIDHIHESLSIINDSNI
ncbi:Polycomb protein Suz12 [Oopsacas minuta]|uniref:Polycomb protein Suz12 n=1 Tax=Oopsacas minuta TaxID=111878 RepID=A0AAV7KKX9_9METZ|nr:Polycomb protein Suz12 [Oopsacas minuta]